jgi:3-methyladenine DNA glycosylase/8-oxoguanine DNA glycosylase
MPTISMRVPEDYLLERDVCSYGYFLLAPNYWDPRSRTLWRVLCTGGRCAFAAGIRQPRGPGTPLRITLSRSLTPTERTRAHVCLTRMLRLDESAEVIAAFHARDPRFAASGRGRLFRSPTLHEDIIKTVTSCNVTWPSTVQMNLRLCEVLGARCTGGLPSRTFAFPDARRLAATAPSLLRARCRVGYRDARIVQLSKLLCTSPRHGGVDVAMLEDPAVPDERVFRYLVELPGIGPYAAANIMQLLGRYGRLPLDTESVRHGRTVLGMKGTAAAIMKRLARHYAPFAQDAFRSYWFELWAWYESRQGPAASWERDSTGKLFTAAVLNAAKRA